MSMEWVFAATLAASFVGLTLAFRRPAYRPIRVRGGARAIRWDAPGN